MLWARDLHCSKHSHLCAVLDLDTSGQHKQLSGYYELCLERIRQCVLKEFKGFKKSISVNTSISITSTKHATKILNITSVCERLHHTDFPACRSVCMRAARLRRGLLRSWVELHPPTRWWSWFLRQPVKYAVARTPSGAVVFTSTASHTHTEREWQRSEPRESERRCSAWASRERMC